MVTSKLAATKITQSQVIPTTTANPLIPALQAKPSSPLYAFRTSTTNGDRSPFWPLDSLLEEIAVRTGDQAIYLYVFDIALDRRIWLVTSHLFKRCVYLCFVRQHRSDFMDFIYTTPAPALARCDIISEAQAPVVTAWKPLFAGQSPSLRELRLVRTGMVGRSFDSPRTPDIPHIGLHTICLIPGLTQLELNFPTNLAKYFPSPSPFAGKPPTTLLPALVTISVVYTFSPESVFRALSVIWQALFQHFPTIDFPSFGIRCYDTTFEFHLLHSSSRLLKIRFDDQALLVAIPGFGSTVKTVTIASSSPNSVFPYHAHLLLSAMVEVTTLQFDDRPSAWHPVWYELLRDKTSLFGYSPLPGISTIVLPASLLNSTIYSNVGLRDLVHDRQIDIPSLRLHFTSSSDDISSFTRSTSAALAKIARAFRVNVSYELLDRA
ncbi:hypothetical protein FA13DRAFT_1714973 [Coprinellus micaceus]|uniref:Uncharacterized protein n=1 Tax=Coprinellus micaceus TaxID=71717 RepID=A0A4Y7SQB0_COPMI|nr:hypothetical protein FA13DRAFT_1714973 [Coprinellus micaceus]